MEKIQKLLFIFITVCVTILPDCKCQIMNTIRKMVDYAMIPHSVLFYPPFLDNGLDNKSLYLDDEKFPLLEPDLSKSEIFVINQTLAALRTNKGEAKVIGVVVDYTKNEYGEMFVDGQYLDLEASESFFLYNDSLIYLFNKTDQDKHPFQVIKDTATRRVGAPSAQILDFKFASFTASLKMRHFHRFQYHYRRRLWRTFCSATIVTAYRVVTSINCLVGPKAYVTILGYKRFRLRTKNFKHIRIVAGYTFGAVYDTPVTETVGQWRKIRNVMHPKKFLFPYNDIGIIELNIPLNMKSLSYRLDYATKLTPARVSDTDTDYKIWPCFIFGYGTFYGKDFTSHLKYEAMHIIACDENTLPEIYEEERKNFVCAKTSHLRYGTPGDAGSGLMCETALKDSDKYYVIPTLVGILSGASKRGYKTMIFSRVHSYKEYILGLKATSGRLIFSLNAVLSVLLLSNLFFINSFYL